MESIFIVGYGKYSGLMQCIGTMFHADVLQRLEINALSIHKDKGPSQQLVRSTAGHFAAL